MRKKWLKRLVAFSVTAGMVFSCNGIQEGIRIPGGQTVKEETGAKAQAPAQVQNVRADVSGKTDQVQTDEKKKVSVNGNTGTKQSKKIAYKTTWVKGHSQTLDADAKASGEANAIENVAAGKDADANRLGGDADRQALFGNHVAGNGTSADTVQKEAASDAGKGSNSAKASGKEAAGKDGSVDSPAKEAAGKAADAETSVKEYTGTTQKDDAILTLLDEKVSESVQGKTEDPTEDEADREAAEKLALPFDEAEPELFASEDVVYAGNSILIKFKKSFSGKLTTGLKNAGVGKLKLMFEMDKYTWYTAYLYQGTDVNEAMGKVRALKNVVMAEYNFRSETAAEGDAVDVSGNPEAKEQYVLNGYGIRDAWNLSDGSDTLAGGKSSVVVAVIDTGVDYTHEDLKDNIWANTAETAENDSDDDNDDYVDDYYGIDLVNGKGSGMDDNGHGTHVAGIIAASNNTSGVVGIAYNTKIMPIKAGTAKGYFSSDNVAKAIIYAYEHGADVINMSFGGPSYSTAVQDAMATAYERCVLVASAGNDGAPNEDTDTETAVPNYPAALPYVIGVMSVDKEGTESLFTNWDAKLRNSIEYDVYAPGEQIMSTLPGNKYGKQSGTSMAAPVVAAQAALLRSY